MANTLWSLVKDFICGFGDSIRGLTFLRELDKDEEYEEINTPGPARKTVLQMRREQRGAVYRPAEKVFRHRERVWKRILMCAGCNIIIILVLKLFSIIFSFIFGLFTNEYYGLMLTTSCCFPIFVVTRIIMALWFSDVAGACLRHLHLPDPPPIDFRVALADSVVSLILGTFFLVQGLLTEYMPLPVVPSIMSFIHLSLLNSMYSFEYFWASRSCKLRERIGRIERRWSYFVGFGAVLTVASSFTNSFIINGCVFAILFPFFIVSSYKANWNRSYPGAEVPEIQIFYPSMLVTAKFSSVITSYLLPSNVHS